ncbi:hypothetical protein, unlikely [Trypanosoma brucei gambiense DAL972]|uniref:Uncharacterized protein n=1 Tax=Trypanosoma brucei gambiense (strain MHOM/CI/86/DAL972) TaxID=679716 RepID=C9ZU93_TRYB9|nr:hypothetical protein, unlikely [Trypanosoma brucei gambiense DAL972]CBH12979.1 hypothetical protein, unlikely [Trypanosoma brucei gambiense DAL972]|eukprot:XP_011775258.1 hypothetical protein, unlikely [Trypanosoma brucei gambiense DAL972]
MGRTGGKIWCETGMHFVMYTCPFYSFPSIIINLFLKYIYVILCKLVCCSLFFFLPSHHAYTHTPLFLFFLCVCGCVADVILSVWLISWLVFTLPLIFIC